MRNADLCVGKRGRETFELNGHGGFAERGKAKEWAKCTFKWAILHVH